MTKRFIPFKKIKTNRESSLHQIKKWSENIFISPKINIDGSDYHLVRTSLRLNARQLRKLAVCTTDGQWVKDQMLTEKIFIVYAYFHYLNNFHKDIISDAKRNGDKQFSLLINALKQIHHQLKHEIKPKEKELLHQLMNYYVQAKDLVDQIAQIAKSCLQIREKLAKINEHTTLSSTIVHELKETIEQRENLRGTFEALLLENRLNLRTQVKNILSKKSYKILIKNKEHLERVIKDLDYLEYLANHFISVGQSDWAFDEKWLKIDKGAFTVEKYILELKEENLGEIFIKTNVALWLKENWLFA